MIDPKYIQTLYDVLTQAMSDAAEANALHNKVKETPDTNKNATEELVRNTAGMGDKSMYYDFVNDVFDNIRDKIIYECDKYAGDGQVLAGMYDSAARRVGGVPTLDDVLRTIFMFKDDDDVALLRYGIDSGHVRERLIRCIMYELLALYALEETRVYHYAGEGDEEDGTSERPITGSNG